MITASTGGGGGGEPGEFFDFSEMGGGGDGGSGGEWFNFSPAGGSGTEWFDFSTPAGTPFFDTGVGPDGQRYDGLPLGAGCGSASSDAWVLDRIGPVDLTPACMAHDACYSTGTTSTRAECDAEFGQQILQECQASGMATAICIGLAGVYQWAVEIGGASAYNP